MDQIISKIKTMLEMLGLAEVEVSVNEEHRRISIIVNDHVIESYLSVFISSVDHLTNIMLKKENQPAFVVDVNYYRKEREKLITELAKAAAHKAMLTKEEVSLPPMNAYERRLVHVELSANPELKTESMGLGKDRYVLIKHL